MRILLAAALLLPSVGSEAAAATWYRIGGNRNTVTYIDADSIRRIGPKTTALTQSIYAKPIEGTVHAGRITSEYDCGAGYFRTLEYSYLDAAGTVFGTEASATIDEHKVPAPGSINESTMKFVCTGQGGTLVADPFADARALFPTL
ncbi:MAG: surface-adhesin E family protein [Sphingomonas sp.]